MARPKIDKRRKATKTRLQKKTRGQYSMTYKNNEALTTGLKMLQNGHSIRMAEKHTKIPKSTLLNNWQKFISGAYSDLSEFIPTRSKRLVVLTAEEETSVERYCLWQHDRGCNLDNHVVKAMIREIHAHATEKGELRQKINSSTGPSSKFMRSFYQRHPKLSPRSGEYVDRGRINMATPAVIQQYFELLKTTLVRLNIVDVNADGDINNDSFRKERVYKADETGWGVQSKRKRVIGRKGAKHVYLRKVSDNSHKTLMLGVCGNGDVLSPLIILEKSFPLIGEGESDHIPDGILLAKTDKGSMEQKLFTQWIEKAVGPHKMKVNPGTPSLMILDNHNSRFSLETITLCEQLNIEMLCYPGHLTHILQGPDVVLNKPISTIVDKMIHNKPIISGNTDMTRIAFTSIIIHAVNEVCTDESIAKAFSATGVMPYNPNAIDLSKFPTSLSIKPIESESPVKATCSTCKFRDVELHPLVRQGVIPKRLAEIFTYTPPPDKTKTKSKIVTKARIITSEEVKQEIREVEERKSKKQKMKLPPIVLKERFSKDDDMASDNDDEDDAHSDDEDDPAGDDNEDDVDSDDEDHSAGDDDEDDVTSDDRDDSANDDEDDIAGDDEDDALGDGDGNAAGGGDNTVADDDVDFIVKPEKGAFYIIQYRGKRRILYYAAVCKKVLPDDQMLEVAFYRRKGNPYFTYYPKDTDTVGVECIYKTISPPDVRQKREQEYYFFDLNSFDITLE